jgi:DNA-binding NarL/FixJ family response regulator
MAASSPPWPNGRIPPTPPVWREQQVLAELATRATNHTIADALDVSERTVAHHVSAILGKLGAIDRVSAIEAARGRGLLSQDRQPGSQT